MRALPCSPAGHTQTPSTVGSGSPVPPHKARELQGPSGDAHSHVPALPSSWAWIVLKNFPFFAQKSKGADCFPHEAAC